MQRGDRARFFGEKNFTWTVQVAGNRYTILTKQAPFKPKGELWYTICDHEYEKRGPCNLVGNGWDMQSRGPYIGSRALHVALLSEDVEISNRNCLRFRDALIEVKHEA